MPIQWKPNVTVAAIAHIDGRFLIVEEDTDNRIVFNQPAGHLEKDETLLDAVRREVMEETGWEFQPESVVGIYLYPNSHVDITYLRVCFAGTCLNQNPDQILDDGIIRAVWLKREELQNNKDKLRSSMVLHCIDDFLSGKKYSLDILNHDLAN